MPKGALLLTNVIQYGEYFINITIYWSLVSSIILLQLLSMINKGQSELWNHNTLTTGHYPLAIQNATCIAHDAKYICDCGHSILNQKFVLPPLLGAVYQLEISNCQWLTINANALNDLQGLRKIMFKSIQNLVLNKYALAYPVYASNIPLIITFEGVNITLIDSHAISGIIEEITFLHGHITKINPFAFTILRDYALLLKLENITIDWLESQAFKKFLIEHIDIKNCTFNNNIPSKAFYEVEVLNTLSLNEIQFQEMHSKALSFKMISKLTITNNNFKAIDAEWLEVYIKDSITIRDNHFGNTSEMAFKGIVVHRDYISNELLELRFMNNTVHFQSDDVRPLEFHKEFFLNIKQLQYDNQFECHDVNFTQRPYQPKNHFFKIFKDFILFNYPSSDNRSTYITLSKLIELKCQKKSYWLYVILGCSILLIIIAIFCILLWYRQRKKRKRLKMDIIQPEPRTYKETQIIYQIENAGLLKTDL